MVPLVPLFAATSAGPSTKVPTVTMVTTDTITINTGATNKIKNDTGGPHDTLTYKVDPLTAITVNGLKGTLADVKAGMKVQIIIGMDRTVAAEITAYGTPPPAPTPAAPKNAKANGKAKGDVALGQAITEDKITSVGTDSITLGQAGTTKLKAYKIDKNTQIISGGKKVELSALHAGMKVRYSVDLDSKTLASITVRD